MKTITYSSLDSTNNEAKRLLENEEAENGLCIIAQEQTTGRGTQGREWVSPKGAGLYLSFVHIPDTSIQVTENLWTMATAVACYETLKSQFDINIDIKPVNDLYIDNKKLGGILTESGLRDDLIQYIITGIGINIYNTQRTLVNSKVWPISLEEVVSPHALARYNPEDFSNHLRKRVDFWYNKAYKMESAYIKESYSKRIISENQK